ncbi:hypothetical protein Pf1_01343 [Flavobacterium columnare]|uniref:hypothetical protein n=1 Tax=Flavobacterium columnare TaxID=996 RepID=UPI0007F9E29E|nr:hypothetical protein [Flavobacterium columnare]ANO49585.1 hypothetical protein Pf1_01343 [Flavobacterium columnare]
MDYSILSAFLPEELLGHFDIVDFIELGDIQTKRIAFTSILMKRTLFPKVSFQRNMSQKAFVRVHDRRFSNTRKGCLFRYQKT